VLNTSGPPKPYVMRISRLTVDKLGVKLYDKVSAAVAELVANAYDADAEKVVVRLPLNSVLAAKNDQGDISDEGYTIEVIDNGHGMTPDEANDFYLQVGRDRRKHDEQGSKSREKHRPVMGRKGIGKLAPFGICQRIEVMSAGGTKTPKGYTVTHFYMDFDKIVADTDEPVQLDSGPLDRKYEPERGTTIRLSRFLPKRVPDSETFHRQLATRFIFARPDFEIFVEDSRDPKNNPPRKVNPFDIPLLDGTRVDLSAKPVMSDDGESLPVSGWLGLAKEAYQNEEMMGVRIYARNKIVATTRDFEQPAGYTGEYTMRSYLVGEVYADWLDSDDGEDLVRTDRQGIIWDSDFGRALRSWGSQQIKEIGKASKKPRRQRTSAIFLERSGIAELAKEKFRDDEIIKVAVDLAERIGAFAAEDELEDSDYVSDLSDVILAVAPHKALIEAYQEFHRLATNSATAATLDSLLDLFSKTRAAEMASYSQIAVERVRAIHELEKIVHSNADESQFQQLIARAPWLIEPTWSVITKNQALKTFKTEFEAFWKKRSGTDVSFAIGFDTKRPDFTLVNIGKVLHIVEIKKAGHNFDDNDFRRLINYVYAFREFFEQNGMLGSEFSQGWRIEIVADGVSLADLPNKTSYESLAKEGVISRISWTDFLIRAKIANEQFLEISDASDVKSVSVATS
jgi:histidine kinase/DNA gyrase B/HSP90-like ATPase